jgi:hypothetical protein
MAHADYTAATKQLLDTRRAVTKYRANEVALRRLAQSRPTRNAGATEKAIARREHDRQVIELSLLIAGHKDLVGWLTDERKLNDRLGKARRANIVRPELTDRLLYTRATITVLLLGI